MTNAELIASISEAQAELLLLWAFTPDEFHDDLWDN